MKIKKKIVVFASGSGSSFENICKKLSNDSFVEISKLYCNNNKSHYHLYIEDEGKIHDIPTKNINLDIPSIPACLSLHNIDVIVRVRSLKEDEKKN